MIVRITLGEVAVYFGEPSSPLKPEPFYPYLLEVGTVREASGAETASASFSLLLEAQALLGIRVRSDVAIIDREGQERFLGRLAEIKYSAIIECSAEA